ncbi:transcriptional regulator [Streptomyces uncialis]|uniref:transcriptional regulator n=1 Tax=Streptomyces uncialis TaxID=1048205 RepID=UPI00365173FE
MSRQKNNQLVALMDEFGYTHEQLADEINRVSQDEPGEPANCTDRHVRRWVSGDVRWPWPRYLNPLQKVFGRSPQEMGFVPRASSSHAPPATPSRGTPPLPPPVERRTFIASALSGVLGTDLTPEHGRLGMTDIARIQQTVTRLDAHFNGLGGGALVDVATDYMGRLQGALDRCTYGERVERALLRAVADVAACAGWSAHDCGDHAMASRLRNEALQAALLARDPVSVTRAWSDLAAQAEHAGRPTEAARINRTALTERHLRSAPMLSALLHARLADCLAQTGDRAGMGRQIAAAERAYDRVNPVGAPSWLAFLTPAELSGLAALAHQSAGQYARAEQQTSQTLDLIESRFTRNRTYYSVLLAELQLAQGHADRAASTAVSIRLSSVESSRISTRLHRVIVATQQKGQP